MFEVNVKIATLHEKSNQLQLLPNHVLQKRLNHLLEGARLIPMSVGSLYLPMNSDNCMPPR